MAQATLYTKTGAKKDAGQKLAPAVFGATPNHELIKLAYETYLANGRIGGAKTLSRGMVRGGGKKPWKQKGTGRARAGSSRLPHWTGGGVAFGPTGNENFIKAMPVKAKRAAIRQALSAQAQSGNVSVIEAFDAGEGKVKATLNLLGKINANGRVLLVLDVKDSLADRATRNVAELKAVTAQYLNVYDIMNADLILVSQKALDMIDGWLGETAKAPTKDKAAPAAKPKAKADPKTEAAS